MAKGKQKWLSDIIGNDYKKWSKQFVAFDGGTGCGKTYFCLNVLGDFAKQNQKTILYLCNRSKLRREVFRGIKKLKLLSVVRVETYQTLQRKLQNNEHIPYYDYIVVDECHYFTTDALFNDYTDVSYNYIMGQSESVVIWVSATAKTFFSWLESEGKVNKDCIYSVEKDYSYVKRLYFYQKDELVSIINDVLENEPESKILVFCNSADRMKEMHLIYEEIADFYCSSTTNSAVLKKICGYDNKTKKVKDCIKDNTFEKRILFTTTVLDNGVDLKDRNIKHIFSEIFDVDSAIQSLGRKRSMDEEDTCTFYMREYQAKAIQGFLNKKMSFLNPVRLYKDSYKQFYTEYGNGKKRKQLSKNEIFYSYFPEDKTLSSIQVNECKYNKYESDINILVQMKKLGHIPVLKQYLGEKLASKSETIVVAVETIDLFKRFLDSLEGKKLYKAERDQIKEEFETIGVKLRYTGINTFNGVLEDTYKEQYNLRFYNKDANGKDYIDRRRKLEDGSENPYRDKRYWLLENRT